MMPEQDEWNKVKASWGDDKLEELIGHFGVAKIGPNQKTHRRVVDPTLVRAQWQTFKHSLYALKSRGLILSTMAIASCSPRMCYLMSND